MRKRKILRSNKSIMRVIHASSSGFTLIELLVTMSIMALLFVPVVVSYVNYNSTQVLNNAALQMKTLLQYAQASVNSQSVPNVCGNTSLTNYKFLLCRQGALCKNASYDYEVDVLCGGQQYAVKGNILPAGVSLTSVSTNTFVFQPLNNTVTTGSFTLQMTGVGTKTIQIFATGVIQ